MEKKVFQTRESHCTAHSDGNYEGPYELFANRQKAEIFNVQPIRE